MAIFQNTFLQKFLKAIWLFSGYFWTIFSNFSSVLSNKSLFGLFEYFSLKN
jgi:hypothetical protein